VSRPRRPSPVPLEVRREAQQTLEALWDVTTRGDRAVGSTLAATVGLFRSLWKLARQYDPDGVAETPEGAFEALNGLIDKGLFLLDDDPAEGRYVHREHETVQ
jgi:hypothetical protein